MKNRRISLALTVFALVVGASFICFDGVRAGLFSSKSKPSSTTKAPASAAAPKKEAEKSAAPEKKSSFSLFKSKPKAEATSASTTKTPAHAAAPKKEAEKSAAPEKKSSFSLFKSKPKTETMSAAKSTATATHASTDSHKDASEKVKSDPKASDHKAEGSDHKSDHKKDAEASKKDVDAKADTASAAPEKKGFFSKLKSKVTPAKKTAETSPNGTKTTEGDAGTGAAAGDAKTAETAAAPKKKGFFSSVGSSISSGAKKAAGAVATGAKKAAVAVGKQAVKAAVSVGKAAEAILKAAQYAGKELYAQLRKFDLEAEQLNMTIPVKSKDDDGVEVVSDLGFVYHFGYTGLGDPNEPFAEIPGEFQSSAGIFGAIGLDLFISKMPGEVGELFKEIKVLSPKMHFFLKFIAACNSLGLISQGGVKVKFDDEKRKQLMANLTMLLSRLSKSNPPDTPPIKPSDIINKLPKFFRSFIDGIDMPNVFTEYDVTWERDCGGKPISAMRKEIANMRSALDYTDRTLIGEENIIPLIESDVVSKLTATEFGWLAYALKHHLYDLDKGPELEALDAEQRQEEIMSRASELTVLFSAVIARIPDQYQAIANDLYGCLTKFAHEVKDEQGPVWEPLDSIAIDIEKPLMGGDAENKKIDLPLSKMLDIMLAKLSMFAEQGFEVDGIYPDGKYLWDDSNLSETNMRDSVTAIILRVIKEKNNPEFNAEGGGPVGFVKYELAKLYNRSNKVFDYLLPLFGPFQSTIKTILGDINAIINDVKATADRITQGVNNSIPTPHQAEEEVAAAG